MGGRGRNRSRYHRRPPPCTRSRNRWHDLRAAAERARARSRLFLSATGRIPSPRLRRLDLTVGPPFLIYSVETPRRRPMQTQIGKWGNSLAVRIPGAYAKDLHLQEGMQLDVALVDG